MLEYDFENSVGFWIVSAALTYDRAMNDELLPQGITYRQCQVLGCLAVHGSLSQSELADRLRIEPPTLVGILHRMERDGWIQRMPCTSDRRRNLISPTELAKPVWSKIIQCARRVRARATKGISASDQATLQRLLDQVQVNLRNNASVREVG